MLLDEMLAAKKLCAKRGLSPRVMRVSETALENIRTELAARELRIQHLERLTGLRIQLGTRHREVYVIE